MKRNRYADNNLPPTLYSEGKARATAEPRQRYSSVSSGAPAWLAY